MGGHRPAPKLCRDVAKRLVEIGLGEKPVPGKTDTGTGKRRPAVPPNDTELRGKIFKLRAISPRITGFQERFRFGAAADPIKAAGDLGVRYAIVGAVDTLAGRLTVTVELFDTVSGGVVWAERYSGALDDVHGLREEIVAAVVAALELRIPLEEARRASMKAPDRLDAWEAYHLGLRHVFRFTEPDIAVSVELFGRAIALDPTFARAHAALSFARFQNAFSSFAGSFEAERTAATRMAERAIELDPMEPLAVHAMGRSRWLYGDLDGAGEWLGRAIALNPNHAQSFYPRSLVDMLSGAVDRINPGIDTAYALSPFDPRFVSVTYGAGGTTRERTHNTVARIARETARMEPQYRLSRLSLMCRMVHARGTRWQPPSTDRGIGVSDGIGGVFAESQNSVQNCRRRLSGRPCHGRTASCARLDADRPGTSSRCDRPDRRLFRNAGRPGQ